MIEIRLTQGQVTVVDECDADLMHTKWFAQWDTVMECYYARTGHNGVGMHRIIMSRVLGRELHTDEQVDHESHDTLDNRRSKLRIATASRNAMNRVKRSDNTSGYKGVSFDANSGKYKAQIQIENRKKHIGLFVEAVDAAKAYDRKAIELFGDFASLNFPESMV